MKEEEEEEEEEGEEVEEGKYEIKNGIEKLGRRELSIEDPRFKDGENETVTSLRRRSVSSTVPRPVTRPPPIAPVIRIDSRIIS